MLNKSKYGSIRTLSGCLRSIRIREEEHKNLVRCHPPLLPFTMADSGEDDAQRYHCGNCHCDITMRLKCAQCADVDLCLECFAAGAEVGEHQKFHNYQLIDDGSFCLLNDKWGAIEEVLLLDAIEQDGLGNWEDAASHMLMKSADEIKSYYTENYIDGVIGEGIIPKDFHRKFLDGCGGESASSASPFTPAKLEHSEQLELGYLPLRDDFDREYENDAESSITSLNISEDDKLESALQLTQLDIYNKVLIERQQRKDIARQHNLIAGKQRQSSQKRKFSKDERELRHKFRPFARLLEPEEYDKLITSLKREKQLKHRIKELMKYRKHGITKLEDCNDCERVKDKKKLQENTNPSSSGAGEDATTPVAEQEDLVYTPGICLLSNSERSLCQSISMKPLKFVNLKTNILKEAALRKYGIPVKHKIPKNLKSDQKDRIINYFSKTSWLS
ncbi:transcriptional adapter 2-beta-like [Dysidea avara]|uniref:transcriptional adapter 2-beta-like n=1 Tax=Dysidea avara TaxID=196820 RepID=UPI003332BC49